MRVGAGVMLLAACAVGAGCGGESREPARTVPPQTAAVQPATTAGATTAATGPAPKLRAKPCPRGLGGYRCAMLTVPLHRRGPHVRDRHTLTLDVAVQRGRHPRGDFVLLSGGPGQPGVPFGPRMAQRLKAAAAGHPLPFPGPPGPPAPAGPPP